MKSRLVQAEGPCQRGQMNARIQIVECSRSSMKSMQSQACLSYAEAPPRLDEVKGVQPESERDESKR